MIYTPNKEAIRHHKFLIENRSKLDYDFRLQSNVEIPRFGEVGVWVKDYYGEVEKIIYLEQRKADKEPKVEYEVKPRWYDREEYKQTFKKYQKK